MITRTFRAAIRIGEDFITLEETIHLPPDATDDQITQAVNIGWRIYEKQRTAIEEQVTLTREGRIHQRPLIDEPASYSPPAPLASDKQRGFIAALQDRLRWTSEQMEAYSTEQGISLIGMTKAQASTLIDSLQKLIREEGIIENFARPIVTPGNKKQAIEDLL